MASWEGTVHHYSSSTPVDGGDGCGIRTMLSRLSIESFDADADEELSDIDHKYAKDDEIIPLGFSSSDSDDAKEGRGGGGGSYSLPATPTRRGYPSEVGYNHHQQQQLTGIGVKEYASENEAQQIMNNNSTTQGRRLMRRSRRRRRRRKSLLRPQRWIERDAAAAAGDDDDADDEEELITSTGRGMGMEMCGWSWSWSNKSFSGGESESGGGGGGLMVITKPKGGRRSLCMDLEEVKACRDLGFELEHERMMQPSRLSLSASTLDTVTTSSAGSSPIANWRISSPGDDPRDVKARLMVWAQAVALASASRHTTT